MSELNTKELENAVNSSESETLVEVKGLKEYFNINVGLFKSKPLKKFTAYASLIERTDFLYHSVSYSCV